MYQGTRLRVPVYSKFYEPRGKASLRRDSYPVCTVREARSAVAADGAPGSVSSNKLFYTAREDDTTRKIAKIVGTSLKEIGELNRDRYPEINANTAFREGSVFRVPGNCPVVGGHDPSEWYKVDYRSEVGWGNNMPPPGPNAVGDENLTDAICYRHWSFTSDPVEYTSPSYMMARRLKKKSKKSSYSFSSIFSTSGPPPHRRRQ